MTVIEFGLLTALSIANSPFVTPQRPAELTVWPSLSLKHELTQSLFIHQVTSARCTPKNVNRWNPITALWRVELGYSLGQAQISVGHQSEHGIDRVQPSTESFDYVELRYRLEFK